VVVDDAHVVGLSPVETEDDPELIVDPDAVAAGQVPFNFPSRFAASMFMPRRPTSLQISPFGRPREKDPVLDLIGGWKRNEQQRAGRFLVCTHTPCKAVPRMRISGSETVAPLTVLIAVVTTACGVVAPDAANQGGDDTPSGGTKSPPVDVRTPREFVVTGRPPQLGFSLDVGGYPLSVDEIVDLVGPAVTVNDASGNSVPVRLKLSSVPVQDSSGVGIITTFEVVSETPQPADAWYSLNVTTIPGQVTSEGDDVGFTVNGYTGHLVYLETASREEFPYELDLQFTEPFDFDMSWGATLFQDADGAPVSACVQAADGCATSGKINASLVVLSFAPGTRNKVSRWNPGVMNVAYGHPGGIRTAPSSDPAPAPPRAFPDGTLPLEFHECPWAPECAQF
jgi:hypothetical protein